MYPFYLKAWDTHDSIIVEGYLLTSTCGLLGVGDARYRTAFSRDFPHFEVGKNLLKSFGIQLRVERKVTDTQPYMYVE